MVNLLTENLKWLIPLTSKELNNFLTEKDKNEKGFLNNNILKIIKYL
jgi:hypothetical protein